MIQLYVHLTILQVHDVRVLVRVQLVEFLWLLVNVAFTRHYLSLLVRPREHIHDLMSHGVPLVVARYVLHIVDTIFTLLQPRQRPQLLDGCLLLRIGHLLRHQIMPTVRSCAPLDNH